jgi:hypothetical protein
MLDPVFEFAETAPNGPDYLCIDFSESLLNENTGRIEFSGGESVEPRESGTQKQGEKLMATDEISAESAVGSAPDLETPPTHYDAARQRAGIMYGEHDRQSDQIAIRIAYAEAQVKAAEDRLKAIEEKEAAIAFAEAKNARHAADWEFIQARVQEGRIAGPEQTTRAFHILNNSRADEIAFSESGENFSPYQLVKIFLKSLPQTVSYGEFAPAGSAIIGSADMSAYQITRAAKELVAKRKSAGDPIAYREAVAIVTQE